MSAKGDLLTYLLKASDYADTAKWNTKKRKQKELDRLENLTTQRTYDGSTFGVPVKSLADYEGRPYIITQADKTDAGGMLEKINDVVLEDPVPMTGGTGHMFANKDRLWAAGKQQMNILDEMTQRLKEKYKVDPILLPETMANTGGNFSHMTGETMLSYLKSNLGKDDKKRLDKYLKTVAPHWKGFDEGNVIDSFNSLPATERGKLQNILDLHVRDKGGLSISEALLATADPNQLETQRGFLRSVGIIDSSKGLKSIDNPSYPVANMGEGDAILKENVSVFPTSRSIVEMRADAPSKYADTSWTEPSAELMSALTKTHRGGFLDEKTIRQALEGAAIPASTFLAINAKADPVDDLRASERQFGMSDNERAIDDLRASEREFVPTVDSQWKPARFEGMATTLGRLKGNENYQNFESIAPFGTGLVDYANNIATGSEQGILDYLMAGGDIAVLPAPLKKAAQGILGMFK